MKKALIKDSIKEIKNTYKRFLSILLMAFLGVGFFAGIRATSPDMVDTIDKYFKDSNVYDIEVVSTLGLTNEDIKALENVEGVEEVYGQYVQDTVMDMDNTELVTKVMTTSKVDTPILIDGKLPENEDECAVEESFLKLYNKKIGDYIEINPEDITNDEGESICFVKQKKLKIVGTAQSPIYISRERGTSKLGSGKVNYFLFISENNLNIENFYTQIYIKTKEGNNLKTSTKEYEDYIETIKNNVEEIKGKREQARYNKLVETATNKVNDAEIELNTQKQEGQEKISDGERQIQEGKDAINAGEKEIEKNENKANNEFEKADNQIKDAKQKIKAAEQTLQTKEQEMQNELVSVQEKKKELQINLDSINQGIDTINTNYAQIIEALKNPYLPQDQKNKLEANKLELEKQKQNLENKKQEVESGIIQIDEGTINAKNELEKAKNEIKNSKEEIKKQEYTLNSKKKSTYAQINNAKEKLENSKKEIENAENEINANKEEFNAKISDAELKLIDARDKIAKIENPKWYILDRNSNTGYTSFIQDTKSIEGIGAVFPIVFFVIATLISLTSMTRMVEEERTQIGTLKALGYNKIQIASKYIIYAALACVIGGILGMCVGFVLLPQMIWMMYEMMYNITYFSVSFNATYGAIGLFAASACIIGATIYAALKELIHTPAVLMRPKIPKNGKRVLLEKIPFIWKKLSFSNKVTIRNIFRYKKRFLMTIIGIFGCTALMVTGFGIKDSIRAIMPNQFEKVFNYDMQVGLKNNLDEEQFNNTIEALSKKDEITEVVETNITSGKVIKEGNEQEIQIIVPKDKEEFKKVINLNDVKTHEKIELNDNEILITDKTAELIGAKVGDTIKIKNSDEEEKEFRISKIVENYVGHYVYMSKDLYEKNYEKYNTNVLYAKEKEITQDKEEDLSKKIIEINGVSSVNLISSIMIMMDDTMNSLNYVVIILIVSSGLLAFVVLYNLANVNISERIRELATIKVLGFYDKEVYNYISRETILLTAIGIILGAFGGYILNIFIISTCEIDTLRFSKIIEPQSYVYSILLTILFTIIVNIATYFSLKKINMIESLKSVE